MRTSIVVPLLDLRAQYAAIREHVLNAVNDVLESQNLILGPQSAALEDAIAGFCDVPHAIAVASGTDALTLSFRALGIGPGDAVITVPYTFFSTAGTIVNLGARPLFVDIDKASFNMDPGRLVRLLERDCKYNLTKKELTHRSSLSRVKAVAPVHLFGQCADMDEILQVSHRYGLPVVEDSCQALGAEYQDKPAGSIGDVGCFSFYPTKNLGGAGDGGMVITRHSHIAQKVRLLRAHGAEPKYFHSMVGFNSRLDEIQAAVLRVKLSHLPEWIRGRQRNADEYEERFRNAGVLDRIELPSAAPHRTHIFHQYVIRCQDRNELRAFLHSRSIGTEIYYPLSLHQQECFRNLGYNSADFPCSREAAQTSLAIPIYPELTSEQKEHVANSIVEFCG